MLASGESPHRTGGARTAATAVRRCTGGSRPRASPLPSFSTGFATGSRSAWLRDEGLSVKEVGLSTRLLGSRRLLARLQALDRFQPDHEARLKTGRGAPGRGRRLSGRFDRRSTRGGAGHLGRLRGRGDREAAIGREACAGEFAAAADLVPAFEIGIGSGAADLLDRAADAAVELADVASRLRSRSA